MTRFIAAFLLLTLATACGKPGVSATLVSVEAEYQPYVDRFVEVARSEGQELNLEGLTIRTDSDMDEQMMAYCHKLGDGLKEVVVNPNWWFGGVEIKGKMRKKLPIIEREEVIFHELGHCLLNRTHDDSLINTESKRRPTIQKSIMNSYHLGKKRYGANYKYYMKELFGLPVDPSKTNDYNSVDEWTGGSFYLNLNAMTIEDSQSLDDPEEEYLQID